MHIRLKIIKKCKSKQLWVLAVEKIMLKITESSRIVKSLKKWLPQELRYIFYRLEYVKIYVNLSYYNITFTTWLQTRLHGKLLLSEMT